MAGLKITRPDGTVVEVDKSAISAIPKDVLMTLFTGQPVPQDKEESTPPMRSIEDLVNGSKADQIAFFLVSQYSEGMTLTTADIHRDWTQFIARDNYDLMIEKSNFTQYLTRLAERGLIDRSKKKGRQLTWTLSTELYREYMPLEVDEISLTLSQNLSS